MEFYTMVNRFDMNSRNVRMNVVDFFVNNDVLFNDIVAMWLDGKIGQGQKLHEYMNISWDEYCLIANQV